MAEALNLSINIGGNANESLGTLKKQLREAQNEVAALSDKFGATSKEAVIAAKRAAELKDRIGDAKSLTDAFNPDAKFKAFSSSLAGVAGGFAAVQGAMGLFGAENKELEKQLLKVQSAMAISQGLQSVGESIDSFKQLGAVVKNSSAFIKANELATKGAAMATRLFGGAVDTTAVSFKVLKGAIAATGIGLLILAVGELVSAFQEYEGAAEKAKKKQEDLNDSIKKGAKVAIDAETATLENSRKLEVATAKSKGASEKEIFDIEQKYKSLKIESTKRFNKEVENINAEEDIANQKNLKTQQTDLQVAELEFQGKQLEKQQEAAKKQADLNKEKNEKIKADQKAANEEYNTLMQQRAESESNAQQIIIESYRNTLPEKEKQILEAEDALEKKKEALIKAGNTNFEQLEAEHKIVLDGINKKYDDEQAEKEKVKNENRITQQLELQTLNAETEAEKRAAEIAIIEEDYRKKIELATLNGEEITTLEAIKAAKIKDINDKSLEDDIKIKEAKLAAESAFYSQIGAGLGQLSELFGKNTAAGKAAALAEIGISSAVGLAQGLDIAQKTAKGTGPAAAFAFPIFYATQVAAVLGTISKARGILSTVKGGGGGSTPSMSMPSSAAPMQPQAPQAQLTQLNQSSINAIGNQSMRAYVVETDVTSSQQRIAAIQQRARFQ